MNIRANFRDTKSLTDLAWILLLLAMGVGGYFMMSGPSGVVIPKLPMLSVEDWKGSQIDTKLTISSAGEWDWEEKRRFHIGLVLKNEVGSPKGEIRQEAQWFADAGEAYAVFMQVNSRDHVQPLAASPLGKDQPASLLFCTINTSINNTTCNYYAYWGHWFTRVYLWSDGEEYFSLADIKQITSRVDQLLLSMDDEP